MRNKLKGEVMKYKYEQDLDMLLLYANDANETNALLEAWIKFTHVKCAEKRNK